MAHLDQALHPPLQQQRQQPLALLPGQPSQLLALNQPMHLAYTKLCRLQAYHVPTQLIMLHWTKKV